MTRHPKPERVSIIREPDDRLAKVRVSLGEAHDGMGSYIVFRGDPAAVVELLENAIAVARSALPAGKYSDRRGRPQG